MSLEQPSSNLKPTLEAETQKSNIELFKELSVANSDSKPVSFLVEVTDEKDEFRAPMMQSPRQVPVNFVYFARYNQFQKVECVKVRVPAGSALKAAAFFVMANYTVGSNMDAYNVEVIETSQLPAAGKLKIIEYGH